MISRRIVKTEGIVLKGWDFKETSKIVTLYTKDFGKIQLLAKGLRRPGSRFGASLEPFTNCSVVFYKSERKELYTISEGSIRSSFPQLRRNLRKLGYASLAVELVEKLTPWESSSRRLYYLLLNFLQQIEKSKEGSLKLLFCSMGLKLATLLGFDPELRTCLLCKQSFKSSLSFFFSISKGGIICENCFPKVGGGIPLTKTKLALLQFLRRIAFSKIGQLQVSQKCQDELSPLIHGFLEYHGDKGIWASLKFLQQIQSRK